MTPIRSNPRRSPAAIACIAALVAGALAAPVAAQTLRVGVATHPPTLDPQKETGNDAAQFLYNIFDTLIERVPDVQQQGGGAVR